MKKQTKNYDQFKFLDWNREIDPPHVKALIGSINKKNELEDHPLVVDEKMNVLDGQHRLLAAKQLGLPVWYTVKQGASFADVLLMNTSKSWSLQNFLKSYVAQGSPHYIKLNEFMKKNNLNLKCALSILCGRRRDVYIEFRNGEFKYENEIPRKMLDLAHQTIDYIRHVHGHSPYTQSAKFWGAFIRLAKHDHFDHNRWIEALKKRIDIVGSRVSQNSFLELFLDIYNYRNTRNYINRDEL